MEIDIESFKKNLIDVARPNRFLAYFYFDNVISLPSKTRRFFSNDKSRYLVKACALPGKAIGEALIKHCGMNFKIAGDLSYTELNMIFLSDREMEMRGALEDWMNTIVEFDKDGKISGAKLNEYKGSTIEVHVLGRDKKPVAKYRFYHAHPININDTDLSMDAVDQVMEISTVFSYSYWKRVE